MGALGGSAIGLLGTMLSGGLTGFGGSVAGDWIAGNEIDLANAVGAGIIGALVAGASGTGTQYGRTGARQAALATRRQIRARNASGGYRHSSNYQFAVRSNKGRIQRATSALNRDAIRSIIYNTIKNFDLNVQQYFLFN